MDQYYKSIATYSKKELLKEARKNMEKLDKMKVSYKRGENHQRLKEKLNIKNLNIEEMDGDTLYLFCVQLDVLISKNRKEEKK